MRRALAGKVKINTKHGQLGFGYFNRHLGYDYRANRAKVLAPESGKVINLFAGGGGGNIVEMQGKLTHRFLHLKSFSVKKGQQVKEGQVIGVSGNTGTTTGPHLHHDARKNGTLWFASFYNYVDWEKMLAAKPKYVVVKSGWGLSNVAKAAGYKDWFAPTAWIRLAKKNGYGLNWLKFNRALKPGQKVKV